MTSDHSGSDGRNESADQTMNAQTVPTGRAWLKVLRENAGWIVAILSLLLNGYQAKLTADADRHRAEAARSEAAEQRKLKLAELQTQERLKKFDVTFLAKVRSLVEVSDSATQLIFLAHDQRTSEVHFTAAVNRFHLALISVKPFFDPQDQAWFRALAREGNRLAFESRRNALARKTNVDLSPEEAQFAITLGNCFYDKLFRDDALASSTPCSWNLAGESTDSGSDVGPTAPQISPLPNLR